MARRLFIARHGETVFNAAARMQGDAPHTPLTRAGFAQADRIGRSLRIHLGPRPDLELWASPSGRTLQTLAIVAEHLELDWKGVRTDNRLREMDMGAWGGRYYRDIFAEVGEFVDRSSSFFRLQPPGGEWYDDIAVRLQAWLGEHASAARDRLVIMHGISSRVLRGLVTGAPQRPDCRAPLAEALPQGSVVCIEDGVETLVHLGSGGHGASAASPTA